VPKHETDAVLALQRGGEDAVEVLIEQLVTASAIGERRGIFDALRQANAGREQLIPLLRHAKWFVVRNVAELIGEMGMQTAVPELAECIAHPDERVRKAVALALAKIGTPNTGEPLRRALRDKSPEVRIQVAVGVGGRRTTGLAMPLIVALQEEEDETVQRELLLALGRIGTPDAVQALIKVAQPSGRLFGRKPTPLRLAAVEALRLAATAPALGTLEGLGGDGDKLVRTAAQAAVWELTKKKQKR
jgi:HEAT repeat protein